MNLLQHHTFDISHNTYILAGTFVATGFRIRDENTSRVKEERIKAPWRLGRLRMDGKWASHSIQYPLGGLRQ